MNNPGLPSNEKEKNSRTVLYNGNIITMDSSLPRAEALAIDRGWIYWVGNNKDYKKFTEKGFTPVDLKGQTVLPGFIDTHCHLEFTGLYLTGVDIERAETLDDVLQCISDTASYTTKGRWINVYNFNESKIKTDRIPDKKTLDKVTSIHPVMIHHFSNEILSLNTKGLRALKVKKKLNGVGLVGGELTGFIHFPAYIRIISRFFKSLPYEIISKACIEGSKFALNNGITTIHPNLGGRSAPESARHLLNTEHLLPVHMVLWNSSGRIGRTLGLGLPRVGGCGDLKADGMLKDKSGALFEPYTDDPKNYGKKFYSQEFWNRFIAESHRMGLQISTHANAEAGIEQVLYAVESALRHYPRKDHRHRIDHLELPTENQMERFAAAQVVISMLPSFLSPSISGKNLEVIKSGIGKTRFNRFHPYKTLIDRGVTICGGSGSPEAPFNPLTAIHNAVNHPNPNERIPVMEALKMFTLNAAYAGFEERERGSINKGKIADIVVLSDDPTKVPQDKIKDIKVREVYVSGVPSKSEVKENSEAYDFGKNLKSVIETYQTT